MDYFDLKDLIGGGVTSISDSDFQKLSQLIELIASGSEYSLNHTALNFPNELSLLIFNYPVKKDEKFKEFAEAARRISSAKYAYYKKASTFKDNFNKLIMSTFIKYHADQNLDHSAMIEKVKNANKMVKYIGELYNYEFYTNENLSYFLSELRKNIESSKVSFDCLQILIEIVSEKVKTESKNYKHNIHIAAINNIIAEYESQGFDHLKKK